MSKEQAILGDVDGDIYKDCVSFKIELYENFRNTFLGQILESVEFFFGYKVKEFGKKRRWKKCREIAEKCIIICEEFRSQGVIEYEYSDDQITICYRPWDTGLVSVKYRESCVFRTDLCSKFYSSDINRLQINAGDWIDYLWFLDDPDYKGGKAQKYSKYFKKKEYEF